MKFTDHISKQLKAIEKYKRIYATPHKSSILDELGSKLAAALTLHPEYLRRFNEMDSDPDMIEKEILRKAVEITNLSEQEITKKLRNLPCSHIEALHVYLAIERFPTLPEAEIIRDHGFDLWQKLYYSNPDNRGTHKA